jgi:prepilin peptidase CpaA
LAPNVLVGSGMSLLTATSLQTQILLIASLVCLVAAIWDLRTGQIPNFLTLGAVVTGPLVQVGLSHFAYPKINVLLFFATSLFGIVFSGLVPFLLWKKNALGGGDLKLLVAVGALLGPMLGLQVQLYAFLIALIIAPAQLAYRGKLLGTLKNAGSMLINPLRHQSRRVELPPAALSEFRFGPAIFLAAVASMVTTS